MAINWTSILTKHKGKWVALKADHQTVIASGKKVKSVINEAKKLGCEMPYLLRVPSKGVPYIG